MINFKQLVEKELKGKLRQGSQEALLLEQVRLKQGELTASLELRAEQGTTPEDLKGFEDATDTYIDSYIDNLLEQADLTSRSKSKIKLGALHPLRDSRGRFISVFNLARLLNVVLYKYVKALMGTGGKLVYRTGRLANSAEITEISPVDDDRISGSIYFTYMLAPYSTFEPGGKQGSSLRAPSTLIDEAIEDALRDLLSPESVDRLRVIFEGV